MDNRLSLYIHWPFCRSKCPYCDFNSHVPSESVDEKRWENALLTEMSHFAAETAGKSLESVFFGGGTPSTMSPDTAAALIAAARAFWLAGPDPEVTLEANPTSVEAGKLKGFAAAGVNRLSLGIQSFDDKALKFLGREHNAKEAMAALDLAREHFARFSFDLIYGLPGETVEDWKTALKQSLGRAGGHLSLYQLSIEKGTPFHRDGIAGADPDRGADLFQVTQELASLNGFDAYEISNHARPGHECRHNLAIWRGGDYAGIGPGAHGRLSRSDGADALVQQRDPGRWLAMVEASGHGTARRAGLGPRERAEELLITGLRLAEGVESQRFQRISGLSLSQAVNRQSLPLLEQEGFVVFDNRGLRATPEGRLRLNGVLAELLP